MSDFERDSIQAAAQALIENATHPLVLRAQLEVLALAEVARLDALMRKGGA